MTHERTLQTLKWALLLAALVGAAWGSLGCGLLGSPTAPDEPEILHPKEIRIIALTDCYAGDTTIEVSFFDEKKTLPQSTCDEAWSGTHFAVMTSDGECVAAGIAYLPASHVGYWRSWVHGSHDDGLRYVASHEVTHVLLMSTDEAKVRRVAALIYGNCQ